MVALTAIRSGDGTPLTSVIPASDRKELLGMPKTVILGAARTPIGKLGGGLSTIDATELGGMAIKAALERADVGPDEVQHVVMGQVLQAGQGQIPSRQAQIKAGIPNSVSSETINKVCASGLRAAVIIDQAIRAGEVEVGVGGGMESMSKAPYVLPNARFGYRMGDAKALDVMIHDGLRNPFSGRQMYEEATEVGDEFELTRPDLDRWALRSHELAIKATDEGRLPEEIVPVAIKGRKGETVVEIDEGPRRDTSLEKLASLPGLLGKDGSHTAGNSPGVNDAGGALVLAAEDWADKHGKTVLAEIVAHAQSANDFAYLATTPARAAMKALEKAGLQPGDIDLWEINEAFASVTLHSIRMLGIEEERVNVNGGAVALGHPIGASGARILGTLVYELRRRGGGLGCAAICSGGGQGDAVILRVPS
jgi:acetyl-CoA C-acetyltransferase